MNERELPPLTIKELRDMAEETALWLRICGLETNHEYGSLRVCVVTDNASYTVDFYSSLYDQGADIIIEESLRFRTGSCRITF